MNFQDYKNQKEENKAKYRAQKLAEWNNKSLEEKIAHWEKIIIDLKNKLFHNGEGSLEYRDIVVLRSGSYKKGLSFDRISKLQSALRGAYNQRNHYQNEKYNQELTF